MKKRIVYGTLLIAACSAVLLADYRWHIDSLIAVILAFLAVAGFLEFAFLLRKRGIAIPHRAGVVFCVLIPLAAGVSYPSSSVPPPGAAFLTPLVLLAAVFFLLARSPLTTDSSSILSPAGALLGLVYVPLPLASLLALRAASPETPEIGTVLLIATLGIIKLGDVAAYFVGSLMGKHPLAPKLSPNKTIEGFLAELLAGALVAVLVLTVLLPVYPPLPALMFGLLVAAAGCAGDLVESKLKRICDVKDSANLLPQFGGVLDLLDSILLGAPVAVLLAALFAYLGLGR